MAEATETKPAVPTRRYNTPYPLIDNDPHIRRVIGYARPSDWAIAGAVTILPPAYMAIAERVSPALVGKGAYPPIMRLAGVIGLGGGFFLLAARSTNRFYGHRENKREQEMDMREMVDKVKKGEPLYGVSKLEPHMQGVAARNSRYSDTAKYYQQAERELEAESQGKNKQ